MCLEFKNFIPFTPILLVLKTTHCFKLHIFRSGSISRTDHCLSVCLSVPKIIPDPVSHPNEVGSSWNFQDKFLVVSQDDPTHQGWPHPPSLQSGTFSVLQVWLWWWGVLNTLIFMLESWFLALKSRITYHDNPWCQE